MTPTLLLGITATLLLLTGVLLAAVVLVRNRSQGTRRLVPLDNLTIDIGQLEEAGPPDHGPSLEVYGVPMRLSILVIAPVGRNAELPDSAGMRTAIESLTPHLSEILDHHQPIFRRWPPQLSAHGFPQAFFSNLQLPGQKGRGTRWCGVAGRFQTPAGQLLAGMIFCGDEVNSLDQLEIEHDGQWRDVLRVRLNR